MHRDSLAVGSAPRIDFTLDYPFEKPFSSSITGDLTLRRIIDAVRSGLIHRSDLLSDCRQRDKAPSEMVPYVRRAPNRSSSASISCRPKSSALACHSGVELGW